MKPVIIYVKSENERLQLSKEEFEQYLNNAYNQGFEDGKRSSTYLNIPYIDPKPPISFGDGPYYTTITCSKEDADNHRVSLHS